MSPELRAQQLAKIDVDAERRKAGVEYLVGFMYEHEAALREAFVPEDTPEQQVPQLIYEEIVKTFDGLTRSAVASFGVTLAHFALGRLPEKLQQEPAMRMGWVQYDPMKFGVETHSADESVAHLYHLTDQGRAAINGYRTAMGYPTIEEQLVANQAEWDRIREEHIAPLEEV